MKIITSIRDHNNDYRSRAGEAGGHRRKLVTLAGRQYGKANSKPAAHAFPAGKKNGGSQDPPSSLECQECFKENRRTGCCLAGRYG
jgi:hypothetical protein